MQTSKLKEKNQFCRTKIICTLGPPNDTEEILEKLILEGLDAGRFNFSHASHEEAKERLEKFRNVQKKLGVYIPAILDTKGPEIRTGKFKEPVILETNQKFTITTKDVIGTKEICSISYKGITNDIKVGGRILIDDGLIELRADKVTDTDIICTVLNTGKVSSNKGVNLPGTKTNIPSLTEKDINDLKFGCANGFDYVAASFIRTKQDCINIKKILKENGGEHIRLISKIESQEGLDNFDEILTESDGIMVARGDLGVEIPIERVPIEQKKMIKKCVAAGKLVITATQMLDSMINNPRPTRAEVTDIANAIFDGTSVIMLSGETSSGKYPVESVRYMNTIALEAEKNLNLNELAWKMEDMIGKNLKDEEQYRDAVSYSVCCTANIMNASAIICVTSLGKNAHSLSKFRPRSPIFAITNSEQTARFLSLEWNVQPVYVKEMQDFNKMINEGIKKFKSMKFLVSGDTVCVSGEAGDESKSSEQSSQMIGGMMTIK